MHKFHTALLLLAVLGIVGLSLLSQAEVLASDHNTYIVRVGDTLSQIAAAQGLTLEELLHLNPAIRDANVIHVGQSIQIPAVEEPPPAAGTVAAQCPQSYTTRAGDSWNSLAQAFGVDAQVLAIVNNRQLGQGLIVGSPLCIPISPVSPPAPVHPASPAPVAENGTWHEVTRGNTLSQIAFQYGCRVLTLVEANRLANPNRIHEGNHLWIPSDCAEAVAPSPVPQPAPGLYQAPTSVPPSVQVTVYDDDDDFYDTDDTYYDSDDEDDDEDSDSDDDDDDDDGSGSDDDDD